MGSAASLTQAAITTKVVCYVPLDILCIPIIVLSGLGKPVLSVIVLRIVQDAV